MNSFPFSECMATAIFLSSRRILGYITNFFSSVCPGLVASNLTGYIAYGTTTEVGAQRIVEMATLTGKNSDVTSTFSDANGPIPW